LGFLIERVIGLRLLDRLTQMRFQLQLAARAQLQQDPWTEPGLKALLQFDFSIPIHFHPVHSGLYAVFQIHPGYALVHADLEYSVLDQNQSLEHDDPLAAFRPSNNLIRVEDDWLGIARDVPRPTDDLLCRGRRANDD